MAERDPITRLHPYKVEEAERRTALVAEFAEIERPTRAVAALYAERLGIRIRMFYHLVRTYRDQGAIRPRYARSRRTSSRLSPAVEKLICAEIAKKGPGASALEIAERVAARCKTAKLPVPSASTVRTRLLKVRRGGAPTLAYPELVLVSTAINVNVLVAERRVAAWLTLLLHTPTASLLSHHISAGSASVEEAIMTLLSAAEARQNATHVARTDEGPIPILLRIDEREGWDRLIQVLEESDLKPVTPGVLNARTADVVVRLLGDQIGWCAFKPRMAAERFAPAGGPGITLELARSMIEEAVKAAGIDQPADVPQIRGNKVLSERLKKLLAHLLHR